MRRPKHKPLKMKSKLTIIFLLFILYSCSIFKNTTKEIEIKNDVKTETAINKNVESKGSTKIVLDSGVITKTHKEATKEQIARMVAEWHEDYTVYDTSRSVDNKTGKYPILSEKKSYFTVHSESENSTKQNEIINKDKKVNLKVDSTKTTSLKEDITSKVIDKSKVSTSEKENNNWWKWLLGGIIATVLGILYIKFVL
jgi:hypothetical protein